MTSRSARRGALAVLVALTLVLTACGSESSDDTATTSTTNPAQNDPTDAFYVTPDPMPDGKAGDVIRSEPLAGAPAGAQAWRVLYRSVGFDGKPIAVSGIIVAPVGTAGTATTGTVPATDRPVLSWAHPTTGVVDSCAPSMSSSVFTLIPGLSSFIEAGYVIAATDYEALGTEGVHPYLIGESEGRSVLDAARAARNLADTGAGDRLLLWGHSQGGQASLFAGQMAPDYAPELKLEATAAAAPAGELATLLDDDADTPEGVVLGAYAVNAYADLYAKKYPEIEESQVVTAEGLPAIPQLVELCDLTQSDQMGAIAEPLAGKFFLGDPKTVSPWGQLLDENSVGGTKITSPVLVTQGEADTIVIPSTTQGVEATYCANGTNFALKTYPGVTHDLIGYESVGDVATWMTAVLDGQTPPGTCP